MYIIENSSTVNYADNNIVLAICEAGSYLCNYTLVEAVEDLKKNHTEFEEAQMHVNAEKFQFLHSSKGDDII